MHRTRATRHTSRIDQKPKTLGTAAMSGGQRSIASFFGGGGAKPAAPAKPDEAENVPPSHQEAPTPEEV